MDTEQLSMTKKTLVGVQFLFVAFGATVLVPLLISFTSSPRARCLSSWAVPLPLSPLSSLQPSNGDCREQSPD